ncbi:MAG: hypothetical protein BA866_03990 [Desulfobulbaceae bacterium S5133MH15]|nr:MAG: hypothetical protein BA866_03990 [Desulfobulbaceae bacterium S5133MH15]
MSTDTSNSNTIPTDPTQEGEPGLSKSAAEQKKDRHRPEFVNIERRVQSHTVFQVDDSSFISSMPRATHWSIAWSDLMMTMFVLFLSMFVYQAAHQEFLQKKEPEIIGGDTTEALKSMDSSGATFPFSPISPELPLASTKSIKKVEPVQSDTPLSPSPVPVDMSEETISVSETPPQLPENIPEPLPLGPTTLKPVLQNQLQEIFTMGKDVLENNSLGEFAAIDIIPDKTMRIILTSDLLFALGESELSDSAEKSLGKIAAVIQQTPYMINIVGHTDNIPMRSDRFKSNWDLSVARASTVARFLINKMGMNPNQFVVSGYSSYRPILPNTNAENRSRNRRVEIIISKRLPHPIAPTANNLKEEINEK